jgi:prephenate dehydrogenase
MANEEWRMFSSIAIAGFGLIGGSLALAVRERWPATRIVAIDRDEVVEAALRTRAADAGGGPSVAAGAELVVLAAPVRQNIALLGRVAEYAGQQALVTDVGSTKRAVVDTARALPSKLRFIGGHPLAGAATGGLDAARADLFRGKPWILTPDSSDSAADVERLSAFVSALGARPRTMEPEVHDRLMAYLSHLPQLAVSALMEVVGERTGQDGLELAGGGLRDTTRLASSPATTWRDVAATNSDAVGEALDEMIAALQRLRADLASGQELQRVFDSAEKWKRVLDASHNGHSAES